MAGGNQLLNDENFKCVKNENGEPITAIAAYDNGRSALCGDEDGNIYCVGANGYHKILSSTLGKIDSIIKGNSVSWDIYFVTEGKVYGCKNGSIIDITGNLQEKAQKLYTDSYSNTIYAITNNSNIYSLSESNGADWTTVAAETAERILKETNNTDRNINDISGGKLSENISSYTSSNEQKYLGTNNGQIYAKGSYEPQPMTVKADYISDAVGTDTSRGIYRVTITGHKLNTEEIFGKGYNGFKYTLSADNGYNSEAYPVNGITYDSDGNDNAALQNREISFLWLGPKCTNVGDHKLTVEEVSYNFSADNPFDQTVSIKTIDSTTIALPPATIPKNDYSNYVVTFSTESGVPSLDGEANGTCAIPFNVQIKKSSSDKAPLPADDDAYNHLIFYTTSQGSTHANENGLVGSNPISPESGFTAILPASSVELDKQYIKYGVMGKRCKTSGGRTFYAYIKEPGSVTINIGLLCRNALDSGHACGALTITGKTDPVIISPNYAGNKPGGRNFTFSGGVSGSNWQGNKWGYGGYLDYQLTDYKNNSYNGIFAYFPEGLNVRDQNKRKNYSEGELTIGYYCDPLISEESPLLTNTYHINDTASYCENMRGKMLYVVLFDQYGRCASYNERDEDIAKDQWEACKTDDQFKRTMQIDLGTSYKTPIIMGMPEGKCKQIGVTERGVFVPPLKTRNLFLTDAKCWTDGNPESGCEGTYEIQGELVSSKTLIPLFRNILTVKGWHFYMNVTKANGDYIQGKNDNMRNAGVTSYNRLLIQQPGVCYNSDLLYLWGVYHEKTQVMENNIRNKGFGSWTPGRNVDGYGEYTEFDLWNSIFYGILIWGPSLVLCYE